MSATIPSRSSHSVYFVDSHLPDLAVLLAGLPTGAEVHLLTPGQDGMQRLADTLQGRTGLDAIHLLTHGSAGSLNLGSTVLTSATLAQHSAQWATVQAALSEQADFLIYGCNVAEGDAGVCFMNQLAQATGANVAASIALFGANALGGNGAPKASTEAFKATGTSGGGHPSEPWDGDMAIHGMAHDGLAGGGGKWQYNTGSGWTDVGTVPDSGTLLLLSSDSIRFLPDEQNGTVAHLNPCVWDGASGSTGDKVSVAARTDSRALATAGDAARSTVAHLNGEPTRGLKDNNSSTASGTDGCGHSGETVHSAPVTGAATTAESGQTTKTLKMTVSGLQNGALEKLTVEGALIELSAAITASISSEILSGVNYSIAMAGSNPTTAVVTLLHAGLTPAQTTTLMEGLALSGGTIAGLRVVTLDNLQEIDQIDHGTNTSLVGLSATVDVPPAATLPPPRRAPWTQRSLKAPWWRLPPPTLMVRTQNMRMD